MQVRGEAGENLCAGAWLVTMRHPALVPDLGWHGREETGSGHAALNLPRKSVESAWTGTSHLQSGERAMLTRPCQGSTGHEIMDMGMVVGHLSGSRWSTLTAELSTEVFGV